MTALYADTSALVRAYFPDEPGHDELKALLLEGDEGVGTSVLTRIEFGSAVRQARDAGRVRRWQEALTQFDVDCGERGPLTLVEPEWRWLLARAHELVLDHPIRTLDAIQLATALEQRLAVFVTRDARQAAAARALGLTVR